MHSIFGTGLRPQAAVDPGDLARQAIANHDLPQLMWQLAQQNVNLNTRNAQGVTLLMETVRHRNANALYLLLADVAIRSIEPELMHHDDQGNTVLHDMAMHLPDAWFDEPSDQPVLANLLEDFFHEFHLFFDWERHNIRGLTAVELAETVHKDNLLGFLATYEVPGVDTSASSDLESDHSFRSGSDGPGDPDVEGHGLLV
ncbi:MAG: hypothetical protein ACT6UH_08640 [Hydrogenophaga sp.]|uniref:hypothetical protein n=1 Tax=unclassified Hydrogenophaga TaxID=2610897 RepID=UPI0036D2DDBD